MCTLSFIEGKVRLSPSARVRNRARTLWLLALHRDCSRPSEAYQVLNQAVSPPLVQYCPRNQLQTQWRSCYGPGGLRLCRRHHRLQAWTARSRSCLLSVHPAIGYPAESHITSVIRAGVVFCALQRLKGGLAGREEHRDAALSALARQPACIHSRTRCHAGAGSWTRKVTQLRSRLREEHTGAC